MAGVSNYPWFKRGIAGHESERSVSAEDTPTLDRSGVESPADYIPSEDLSHAVNVALALGMPLLVTGEPGTGKTQLASALAYELQAPLHKFETKSTSAAKDLFYTYDAMAAFKAKGETDARTFLRYQALGRAIIEAFPADHEKISALMPPAAEQGFRHPGAPRRAVVLIDEIDKAPRDFPNDLLNEVDRLTFRVPELMNIGSPGADEGEAGVSAKFRPIVILTSNSEKGLPDPFLRRCIYFDIPFPGPEQMARIVAARISTLGAGSLMYAEAIDLFYALRRDKGLTRLVKEPSTAELLNWLQVMLYRGMAPGESMRSRPEVLRQTISTLVKNKRDREEALDFVENRWNPPAGA